MQIVIEFAPRFNVRDKMERKKKEIIQAIEKALLERGFPHSDFSVYFTWKE